MVSCCKLLGVRSFVLKVRSQSGHRCSCKPPPKQMLFSVLTRKGEVPRLNFHPPRSRPWLRGGGPCTGWVTLPGRVRPAPSLGAQARVRRQISAGGALRARSPDPTQPSSLREPGAQDPAGPWAFHLNWSESFV